MTVGFKIPMRSFGRVASLAILTCAIALTAVPGSADQIRLKNGDRLTGKVLSLEQGRLVIVTDYAGKLALPWEDVASLTTDEPVMVTTTEGEERVGWMEPSRRGKQELAAGPQREALPPGRIAAVRPLTATEAKVAKELVKPPEWATDVEAGVQVRSGNTDTQDYSVGLETRRRAPGNEFTGKARAAYSETESERTVAEALGEGRLEVSHGLRPYSFYLLGMEHDAIEDLTLRATQATGLGYKFILTERTRLQADVGPGLREEIFEDGESEVEPIARLGAKWRQQIATASELGVDVGLEPSLLEMGEYRLVGEGFLRTPLTDTIFFKLSLLDQYDSNPQPGVEKNDLTVRSSLGLRF